MVTFGCWVWSQGDRYIFTNNSRNSGLYQLKQELITIFPSQDNDTSCTREEIEAIFSSADKDGSGQLNIKEFIASSKAVNMVKEAEKTSTPKSSGQKRFVFKKQIFDHGENSGREHNPLQLRIRQRWPSSCLTRTRTASSPGRRW